MKITAVINSIAKWTIRSQSVWRFLRYFSN